MTPSETLCECGHALGDHQSGVGPWSGFCGAWECKCESPTDMHDGSPLTLPEPSTYPTPARLDAVADAAGEAFWAVIAAAFPGIPGDVAPEFVERRRGQDRAALRYWLEGNHPAAPEPDALPGYPCECGHYRHDDFGHCSGVLGSMLDTDALGQDDDRLQRCDCTQYVPADPDWARGVGFLAS